MISIYMILGFLSSLFFVFLPFLMARKDFDNLVKTVQVANVVSGTTVVSTELDLNLPRGYVAKISRIKLYLTRIGEDFESNDVDALGRVTMALLRDPDDNTTIGFTSGETQHDVIAAHEVEYLENVDGVNNHRAAILHPNPPNFEISYREDLDVLTARNLRFNCQASGTDAAAFTESFAIAEIDYTLEKVTDNMILELLDIL